MGDVASGQIILLGVMGSFIASLGTAVGSGGVLFIDKLSRRLEDGLLSGAAGIMLAATFFSLLLLAERRALGLTLPNEPREPRSAARDLPSTVL